MSEGVQSSGQPDATGSHPFFPALLSAFVGAIAIFGFWKTPPGSHSGETLLVVGLGLIAFGAAIAAMRRTIPNPRDFFGGLALLAIALFAIWASGDLPGTRGFAFGPGTAPRMFAVVLGLLSIAIVFISVFSEGPSVEKYDIKAPLLFILAVLLNQLGQSYDTRVIAAAAALLLAVVFAVIGLLRPDRQRVRGPLFVTLGVIFFALSIRQLGLVITSYVTLVLTAYASNEFRWAETLLWAGFITAFCYFLFVVALNLPFQPWPVNFDASRVINLQ